MIIGLTLGMIAGYGPKWLDNLLMLFFDTIRSFPTVMFALAVVALVGSSLQTVVFVVMATSIPTYGRVARTQTLTLRNSEFILAERSMGASMARILGVHMLPNIIGVLAVLAAMDIPTVIALEAGLSFLGLGVKPPTPNWGALLKDGYTHCLLSANPDPDPDARLDRIALKGELPSLLKRPSGCEFRERCPFAKPFCTNVPQWEVDNGHGLHCLSPMLAGKAA